MGGLAQRRRGGEVRELEEQGETIGGSIVMAPPFSLECAQAGRDFGVHMIGLRVADAWMRRARICGDLRVKKPSVSALLLGLIPFIVIRERIPPPETDGRTSHISQSSRAGERRWIRRN